MLDEYYVVNKDRGEKIIESKNQSINNYSLHYYAETREMYMAFFVPKSIPNKYMISAVYCKFNYGWKLTRLEVSPYTYNGKTAPELYFEVAKKDVRQKLPFRCIN